MEIKNQRKSIEIIILWMLDLDDLYNEFIIGIL